MSEDSDTGVPGSARYDVAKLSLVVGIGVGMHQRNGQRFDA